MTVDARELIVPHMQIGESNSMNPKQRAAEAALDELGDGMIVGLGTGSTADFFLSALGAALRDGRLKNIRGVPTSVRSEQRARELGIPILLLEDVKSVDVTVDGADEVTPQLDLIKGLGGALLREKLVAQSSRRLVIIADSGKLTNRLGEKCPLPVEVVVFAYRSHEAFFRTLGAAPVLRKSDDGNIFRTDNGNYIYDCRWSPNISDVREMENKLRARAGVVATGLFLGMATRAIVADDRCVRVIDRAEHAGLRA